MADYDIGAAFKAIEEELIASMIRNMDRHRAEETKEGYNWSMWQAEQLKALEKYKKQNRKRFGGQFKDINGQIAALLQQARSDGNMKQEITILNAIKNGFKGVEKAGGGATAEFFRMNDRKLEALIEATTHDMERAETAVLRMADDQYRKAIYNAQVYANSGAGTYEKAVDMATKGMLSHGLNCVEYANGARHTLADYADMAIRTASKRAYLQGEGEKRQEWGITTVIMNKRGNPCPKCLPFVGQVLIDDVWSGGSRKDGKYPLMSTAIAAGLYHPRCKDSHTTYFPGISTADDTWTKEELEAVGQTNKQEARQQYAGRQAEKFGRLAKHSLDVGNKKQYEAKEKQWSEQTKAAEPAFTPAETIEEAQQYADKFLQKEFMDKTFQGVADFKGISLDSANAINRALDEIYNQYDIGKISGLKAVSPTSAKGKKAFKDGADAIASYDPIQHGIYLNKDILGSEKKFAEHVKKSEDAWELVMKNRNSLTGAQRELADTYARAGRSLVDGKTIDGVITHEMGHHVQWTVLDTKTNNLIGNRMKDYAPQISGYANASKGEYIAESFAAYMKGEKKLLDPDFTDFLDGKRIDESKFPPRKATKRDYLLRDHQGAENTEPERKVFENVCKLVPSKVQDQMADTIVDVGQIGASQYDYSRDILYIAKGADEEAVIHEMGHLVESKMILPEKVDILKRRVLEDVSPLDFVNETYYDASGAPVDIFLIKSSQFVSDYQGRVYINDWSELLDDYMRIKPELVAEFVSEPFREYIENPEGLKNKFPEFYELIREAVE